MVAALQQPAGAPFGTRFADVMGSMEYRDGAWTPGAVVAVEPIALHPAAHVLHYGSACFEGLKAYRWADGSIRTFRLDRHLARLRVSARTVCLPIPAPEAVQALVEALVRACAAQVPEPPGALYLRPALFGVEPNIGAAATPSAQARMMVLAAPVGDYFAKGDRPLTVAIEERSMRSTPTFGAAKAGANYVQALGHVERARAEHGADQVLFCPGGDVQETGASNFILIDDDGLLTKPLDGSFLHGVTRDSVLTLARHLGMPVTERSFTVDELVERAPRAEAALSGTAAVLSSVGTLVRDGERVTVGDGTTGRHTARLRKVLTDIQRGHAPDPFGWTRRIA